MAKTRCRTQDFVSRLLQCKVFFVLVPLVFLFYACNSELIERQEKQIREQSEMIKSQRQEIEALRLAKQKAEQRRKACNRAFVTFEKAQKMQDEDEAVALYRQGLKRCPGDDVAHYELGKLLARTGQTQEAEREFEEALKINPKLHDAKRRLEAIHSR